MELKEKITLFKETRDVYGRHEEDFERIASLMYDSASFLTDSGRSR